VRLQVLGQERQDHVGHLVGYFLGEVVSGVLALAAAIWHNFQTGQPVSRSLTAYDH
jgi:hypothetical protein